LASQRNTLAVDHHHPLRPLAPLGLSDGVAPFLAGAKLPSRKLSLQSRRPPSSSSDRKARHIRSQIPWDSQRWSRFQHTLGLTPKSLGRSRHRAPERRIQRMAWKTTRFGLGGLPRRRPLGWGSRGSIFSHCESLTNGFRMAIVSQRLPDSTSLKCWTSASCKTHFRNQFQSPVINRGLFLRGPAAQSELHTYLGGDPMSNGACGG
jgi:hypothetical protein